MTASTKIDHAEGDRDRVSRLAVWVLIIGIAVSVGAAIWVWSRTDTAARAAVASTGGLLADSIGDAVDGIGGHLVAISGLYQSSEEVTRVEFNRFVRTLGVAPGVAGVAYAPIVTLEERNDFVAGVRPVLPDYRIFEFSPDGERVPAEDRDRYVPVQWSYPTSVYGGVYGYDISSWPPLAESIDRAAATRTAAVTPFMELTPLSDQTDIFAVVWPVPRVNTRIVEGFTVALVDLSDFLEARLPPTLADSITWRIFDQASSIDLPDDWWVTRLPVSGSEWTLAVSGVKGMATSADRSFAILILLAGLLASVLAAHGVSAYRQKRVVRDELERMRELSKAKDQFLASVSHELRTPLTSVVGFTALLREPGHDLDSNERGRMMDSIARESADLAAIIDDLLVAARSELELVAVTSESVELKPLIEEVLQRLGETVGDTAHLSGPDDSWSVRGDPARIRQVVRNLVVNARRYGGERLEVRLQRDATSSRLQVADSGLSLPPDEWERIFEPYHRVHRVVSKPASLGIGLSVSRHLARLMGGDLVYRHEDGWSIFEVSLSTVGDPAVDVLSEAQNSAR